MDGSAIEKLITEISKRCGHNWKYKEVKDVFNEMSIFMNSLNNITWERLEKENYVTYPVKSENLLGEDIIFHDGFPTPNKLGKIMPVDLIYPNDEISSDFPMILSTGRLLEHWHTGTMTRRALVLDELESFPIVFINEIDSNHYVVNIWI